MAHVSNLIYTLTTWVLPLMLTIILHEIAHGYVAMVLGDSTAKRQGRLTLNPIAHVDLWGTVIVPLTLLLFSSPFLMGWAKPVPVNFSALDHPKRDMGLVALAGPVMNFILAILFVLIWRLTSFLLPADTFLSNWILQNVMNGVILSVIIGIFNLFPVLPLDGGRIVVSLLPQPYAAYYQETERYGFFILLGLIFILPHFGIDLLGLFIHTLYPFFMQTVTLFL